MVDVQCRLTQHSLPGGLLGLTWAGLAPVDRASFAGAFDQLTVNRVFHGSIASLIPTL